LDEIGINHIFATGTAAGIAGVSFTFGRAATGPSVDSAANLHQGFGRCRN
jgi:hypothetical protein